MPFNRITLGKSFVAWLAVLQSKDQQAKVKSFTNVEKTETVDLLLPRTRSVSENEDEDIKAERRPFRKPLKFWFPGLLLIPIPEAGWFLGYVDIAYWAVMTYVIGSVTYLIDSFYLWPRFYPDYTDDAANPAIYWNTVSAALFVFNALTCILDWYLQKKQLSFMNMTIEDEMMGIVEFSDISSKITRYYFMNNLFFLAAALVFLIQGIWMEDIRTDATHCYLSL
jgi:hypothetical protein